MITVSSLRHPSTLANIKNKVQEATERASREPTGVHVVPVYNRRNQLMMEIVGIKDRPFKAKDSQGEEITSVVQEALEGRRLSDNELARPFLDIWYYNWESEKVPEWFYGTKIHKQESLASKTRCLIAHDRLLVRLINGEGRK